MTAIVILALIVGILIYLVGHAEGRRSAKRDSAARIRREINRSRAQRG